MVYVVVSFISSLLWILRMFIAAHFVFSVTFTLFVCVALHTTTLQHAFFQGADFTKPLQNKGEAYLVGATTYAERVSCEAENRREILYLSS